MANDNIQIKGARVNNLKNISLEIRRNNLVVIMGVSGSGKSSLAFDTLYAEGQRRYVESLSSYARMFLGRMSKPECDFIKGIPPAIAIEQKVTSRNPRSTVGTSTEIYEYLRLLYARIGRTYSPISGQEVKKHTTEDVLQCILSHNEGEKFMILCNVNIIEGRTLKQQLGMLMQNGFVRIEANGMVTLIEEYEPNDGDQVRLIVDRMSVHNDKDTISRIVDSSETAFFEGNGELAIKWMADGSENTFSTRFEADGMTFSEPSDNLFAFNSPAGACPECEGFGKIVGIDEQLVIPDSSLSVYEGAVVCWRGEKMSEWKTWFMRFNSERGFPIHKPYFQLTQEEKDWLWHGTPLPQNLPASGKLTKVVHGKQVPTSWNITPEEQEWGLMSIDAFFDMLRQGQYKIQNRVMLARYRGKTTCPKCHGTRLRPEAGYVRVAGKTITELVEMSVTELKPWVDSLIQDGMNVTAGGRDEHDALTSETSIGQLTPHEQQVAGRIVVEIRNRLQFLLDVGLGYLTMNRLSNSLSGGESQRINLATSLGSSLVGSLYILDEPSIGLHSRDTDRLIHVLKQLRDLGNTVVVVEHDEEIMRAADWIIDIGPDAGRLGGQVVYSGEPTTTIQQAKTLGKDTSSHTVDFLSGIEKIDVPSTRRPWNMSIWVKGAKANNLKNIDAQIPLNVMTCVTGVSGSGKSSLIRDIFYNAVKRQLDQVADRPGEFLSLEGNISSIKAIEFVDQNPIGKSSRSNPVTYVKAWDEIRKLFADLPFSKQMGFTAGYFSFNTEGGRCEECKGDGTVTVEMQFMADLILECPSCHGKRFKNDILDIRYEGKNVNDILNMTINQAIEFFTEHGQKKVVTRLKPLQDVGLGYIKLGQTSNTLSGGENQRVKLAYYLGMEQHEPTIFIFDEPTTGLHFHDIKKLLDSFEALIKRGHTVVIIEHNMDVIKCADYVIDLGPEGGDKGGTVVCCGTPEDIAKCPYSYTGAFLKEKLSL